MIMELGPRIQDKGGLSGPDSISVVTQDFCDEVYSELKGHRFSLGASESLHQSSEF